MHNRRQRDAELANADAVRDADLRELFRSIMQNPLQAFVVIQDERIVAANDAVHGISGYSVAQLCALPAGGLLKVIHPDDQGRFQHTYQEQLAGQAARDPIQIRLVRKNGNPRPVVTYMRLGRWGGRQAIYVWMTHVSKRATGARDARQGRQQMVSPVLSTQDTHAGDRALKLEDVHAYMEAILETSRDGILVVDKDGRFEYGNPAFYQTFGWPREDIIGAFFMKVIPPDLHDYMLERWDEVQRGEGKPYETDIICKNGERRSLFVSHTDMTIDGNRKYVVVTKDVTAHKQAERELAQQRARLEDMVLDRTRELTNINRRLAQSEALLARAQASSHTGSWEADPSTGRMTWSDEMYSIYGIPKAGGPPRIRTIYERIHPDDRNRLIKARKRLLKHHEPAAIEIRMRKPDGSLRHLLVRAELVDGPNHKSLVHGTMQDISLGCRLEREIVRATEHEKQRLGRELHDSLGQELAGLALLAKVLEREAASRAPELVAMAAELSELAATCAGHARDIARGLSPVDVAEDGLASELQKMADRIASLCETSCRCTIADQGLVHDNTIATNLYHIAQEAVTNAVMHSGCAKIDIHLTCGDVGYLTIRDNGRWRPACESHTGIGLRVMRHRAEAINARLDIENDPASGTCVTCTFPNLRPERGSLSDRRNMSFIALGA